MVLGLGETFGLVAGAAVGLFIGLDPMHRIWPRHASSVRLQTAGSAGS
jgi:hypothetical protein